MKRLFSSKSYRLAVCAGLVGLALSGCSRLASTSKKPVPRPSNSGTNYAFSITAVVLENGQIVVLGDNSGAIQAQCQLTTTGTITTSNCKCEVQPGESSQPTYQLNVTSVETDIARCPNTQNFTNGTVRILNTSSGLYTNAITVGGLNQTEDSFVQVQRFQGADLQCYQGLGMDLNICDPIEMRDQRRRLFKSFYSTNLGKTKLLIQALSGAQGATMNRFEFNFQPTPGNYFLPTGSYRRAKWENLPILSRGQTTLTDAIYNPTAASNPKHDFFVAKKAGQPFTIPVYAELAPGVFSARQSSETQAALRPPLGYAAAPVPTTVPGQSLCSTVTANPPPLGYEWAKLWHFVVDVGSRSRYSRGPNNWATKTGAIICNPEKPEGATEVLFPDCNPVQSGDTSAGNCSLGRYFGQLGFASSSPCWTGNLPPASGSYTTYMAARVYGITSGGALKDSVCAKLDPVSVASPQNAYIDYVSRRLWTGTRPSSLTYLNSWNLPSGNFSAYPPLDDYGVNQPSSSSLEPSQSVHLFVVTPETINVPSSSGSLEDTYTPVLIPFLGAYGDIPAPPFKTWTGTLSLTQPGFNGGQETGFPLCVLRKVGP